jgi:hypothetical protein
VRYVELCLTREGQRLRASDPLASTSYSGAALVLYAAATSSKQKKLDNLIATVSIQLGLPPAQGGMAPATYAAALERLCARKLNDLQARVLSSVFDIKELRGQAQKLGGSNIEARRLFRKAGALKASVTAHAKEMDMWLSTSHTCAVTAAAAAAAAPPPAVAGTAAVPAPGAEAVAAPAPTPVTANEIKTLLETGEPPEAWQCLDGPRTQGKLLHWGWLQHKVACDLERCEEEKTNIATEKRRLHEWLGVMVDRIGTRLDAEGDAISSAGEAMVLEWHRRRMRKMLSKLDEWAL